MKFLQGRKRIICATLVVILMIIGSIVAIWPKSESTAHSNATQTVAHTGVNSTDDTNDVSSVEAAAKRPFIDAVKSKSAAKSTAHSANDAQPKNTQPLPSRTPPTSDPQPTPVPMPSPVPDPTPAPIDPPIAVDPPYQPPTTCGGCGVLPLSPDIMCPMNANGSVQSYLCRMDPSQV